MSVQNIIERFSAKVTDIVFAALVWPLPFSMIVISIIAYGVQNFLAMRSALVEDGYYRSATKIPRYHRIYRLMGHKWLLYIFFLWSTATMIFGLVYGVKITMSDRSVQSLYSGIVCLFALETQLLGHLGSEETTERLAKP